MGCGAFVAQLPSEEVAKREMTRSYTWTSLSRKFEKVDNQEDELSMLRVMAGYIWWNLRDRAVRVGTIKLLAKERRRWRYVGVGDGSEARTTM